MSNSELESSFLKQVNAHIRILYKVSAVYHSDPVNREDAVQDMLYQLWRAYPTYQGRSAFSTWMYRVALNTMLSSRKITVRQPSVTSMSLLQEHPGDMQDLTKKEQVEWLYSAIRQLGEVDRAIILLYLEGYSYEEIAAITGLTRSNVSVRIVRIKKALEAQLKNI